MEKLEELIVGVVNGREGGRRVEGKEEQQVARDNVENRKEKEWRG